jgi:hypothetical protein
MEALNEKTQTRMRKSITVEHSLKPEDLGKAFKDLVDQGAVPAPGPQTIEKNLDETMKTPVDLQLRYGHDRNHLIFLWAVLAGFAAAFAAATVAVLSWKDRQEG